MCTSMKIQAKRLSRGHRHPACYSASTLLATRTDSLVSLFASDDSVRFDVSDVDVMSSSNFANSSLLGG